MARILILFVFSLFFIPSSFPQDQDKKVADSNNERVTVYKYFQDSEGYSRDGGKVYTLSAVDFEETHLVRYSSEFTFWFKGGGQTVYGKKTKLSITIPFSLVQLSQVRLETRLKLTAPGTSVEVLQTNSRTDIIFNFATKEGMMKWRKTLTDAGLGHLLWPNPKAQVGIGKDAELLYIH